LIENPGPQVAKELNLIRAVKKLADLGLKAIPVQIRLKKNKMELIQELLEQNLHLYMRQEDLLELGELLGRDKEDMKRINLLIAKTAFQVPPFSSLLFSHPRFRMVIMMKRINCVVNSFVQNTCQCGNWQKIWHWMRTGWILRQEWIW